MGMRMWEEADSCVVLGFLIFKISIVISSKDGDGLRAPRSNATHPRMCASAIFARSVTIILVSRVREAQAIGSTRCPGRATPGSTSKIARGKRRPIRSNRFCEQSRNWRVEMPLTDDRYTYRVTWSEEDREHVGLCAEFPSLSWLATTPEAALKGIRRVVADVVAEMAESRESVPEPMVLRRFSGKFMVRVPPEIHRRLVMEATEAGVSLNSSCCLLTAPVGGSFSPAGSAGEAASPTPRAPRRRRPSRKTTACAICRATRSTEWRTPMAWCGLWCGRTESSACGQWPPLRDSATRR